MASDDTPLDEKQFSFPGWFEDPFWRSLGGLNSNTVLWYFVESPFFDRMSNNAILSQQLSHNENLRHILLNRDLLEARLKTMSGLEFVVSEQPADPGPTGTGVWVVRKQMRRKKPGEEDEVTVLNSYHIVDGKIYMAPLAADLLKKSMVGLKE
jgi:mediator of RNA polymerase II transcription subunit 6